MRITNSQGLPQPFVDMAQSDYQYREGRYSVTSLLKGVREMLLERRHHNEIEQDVSDMIWLLFGTAVHSILERSQEGSEQFKEIALEEEIGARTISGRFDLYDAKTQTIVDYKTCSVWKVIKGDYEDWKKQLLMYAYLLRMAGFPVKSGQIVAIMKDHSKAKARFDPEYPNYPVKVIKFRFSAADLTMIGDWLKERVAEIRHCEMMSDDELPVCTPEERYNAGDKWAVMKKGAKRALKLFDSQQDAEQHAGAVGGLVECRPGEDKKCAEYCRVSQFCNYWNSRRATNDES